MADIKQFVTPDNLGPDFEQDATAKEIKLNIDGVTLIRNADGKLASAGGVDGVSKEYVDDLTAVDGVTVVRNAEGELVSVGEVSKEYVDDLTAIDGVTIIRNAEGELVSVRDSVAYNITELPDGAVAPRANPLYNNSLAAGDGARANGPNSVAVGRLALSTQTNGIAIGFEASARSAASISVGAGAESSGLTSVAIGNEAKAPGTSSVAIGPMAEASDPNSVALGTGSNTTKGHQVSIALLDETTHLAATPRLLSGVKTPEVSQDAANKEYVDDLTKVDGTTITRNAEGELTAVGGDGADCCEPLTPQLEFSSDLSIVDGRLRGVYNGLQSLVIPVGRQVKLFPQTITGVVNGEDVEITINTDLSWSCNLPVEGQNCTPRDVHLSRLNAAISPEGFLAGEYAMYLQTDCSSSA